jgi:hypothetical protein
MKKTTTIYIKLSKTALAIMLCLALCLPPAGLIWAQSAPADAGQAKCLDSQRMAKAVAKAVDAVRP